MSRAADRAPPSLWALLETARGGIDFLGRRSDAAALRRESEALAAGLAVQGLGPGAAVGLFLPNTPTLLVGLFACVRAGLRPLLLDPRDEEAVLAGRLRDCAPRLILTQNPAPLFDKLLRLLPACPDDSRVAVGRFTDLLPFPRNLLLPLLRGGGLAALPPDPRFLPYRALLGAAASTPPEDADRVPPPLELPGGPLPLPELLRRVSEAEPAAAPGRRWLVAAPLAREETLAAVLRALHDGAELLLSPRLDTPALDKLSRQAGVAGRIE